MGDRPPDGAVKEAMMHGVFPEVLPMAEERRRNGTLRAIYEDAAQQLQHLFRSHDDWVGSSIDYAALRMVHERYSDLSAREVRTLVTSIGSRLQHCVSQNRLTALYP
jgi:lipase chaperone LimK